MTLSSKLISFRKFNNMKLKEVAEALDLSEKSYDNLEKGLTPINRKLAQSLSKLYHAPIEIFTIDNSETNINADVVYHQCVITSGDAGTSGYINHQNNAGGIAEINNLRNQEVERLDKQIKYLCEQNNKLLSLLKKQLD